MFIGRRLTVRDTRRHPPPDRDCVSCHARAAPRALRRRRVRAILRPPQPASRQSKVSSGSAWAGEEGGLDETPARRAGPIRRSTTEDRGGRCSLMAGRRERRGSRRVECPNDRNATHPVHPGRGGTSASRASRRHDAVGRGRLEAHDRAPHGRLPLRRPRDRWHGRADAGGGMRRRVRRRADRPPRGVGGRGRPDGPGRDRPLPTPHGGLARRPIMRTWTRRGRPSPLRTGRRRAWRSKMRT